MLGLGLGVSKGGYIKPPPLPSKVFFVRDGNFGIGDTFHFATTVSNGTAAFSTDTFAGSSNFLKITNNTTGTDTSFYIDKSFLNGNLDDYYAAAAEGGSFKTTIEYGFPSSNTDTGTVSRVRTFIGSDTRAVGGPSKDTIVSLSDTELVSAVDDPSGDVDYVKFEFEDPTANEPVSGDVMYVKKIQFEYIAA